MTNITLSAFLVTLVVSYVIPLVTALITKVSASATLKQFVSGLLAAITGFLTNATMQDGSAVFSKESLLFAAMSFMTANIAYVGTYRPHDIGAKIVPLKGLGKAATDQPKAA